MANVFKKLAKGAKKLVTNPGGWAKNVGKDFGKGFEAVDDIALPVLGFATMGPAGAALGSAAARGIGNGKFDPKAVAMAGLKGGALGMLGGAAGLQGGQGLGALGKSILPAAKGLGGKAVSGLGKLGSGVASGLGKLGKAATFTDGQFDMEKLMGLGLAGSGFVGTQKDKAAAAKFNTGNADMRNALLAKLAEKPDYSALMDRITARPNYTF